MAKKMLDKWLNLKSKIAVVVGNGSSRRLAPDAFGAVALDPSGGESLLEVREFYCLSEFGFFFLSENYHFTHSRENYIA